jgi:tRNA(Ile)-lysidine synthase
VSIADEAVRDEEASELFGGLENLRGLVLAVSGGSDSTALLVMAARWAKELKQRRRLAPKLIAVTVDHGLRPEAGREAAAVRRLARVLGVPHRTLRWHRNKPKAGLQAAARMARYRLLAQAAARAGYEHVLTAHTLDDQAETVLFRLARGSGLSGLAGMAYASLLPVQIAAPSPREGEGWGGGYQTNPASHSPPSLRKGGGSKKKSSRAIGDRIFLVRPFLHIPKSRLIATIAAAGVGHSEDPSNRDPRFARTRLRALMPHLAREGLDAKSLGRLAARMRRAEATIEFAVGAARASLAPLPWRERGPIVFDAPQFNALPAEVALRLLGRAIAHVGNEGPVELGKLELLYDALRGSRSLLRRTLAGAVVTLGRDRLTVERAPARRTPISRKTRNERFTE